MAYSEKQKEYVINYMKEKLDEIKFRVPKGQKAFLRAYAENRGEKLTPFIIRSIKETIYNDLGADTAEKIVQDWLSDNWAQGKTENEKKEILVEALYECLLEIYNKKDS